jgi:hypothetical protein
MRGGRARWKLAHETLTPLKHQGSHCEPKDGHGTPPLAVVFALRMRLAFVVDQTQPRGCALFQTVWAKLGRQRLVWARMSALWYDSAVTAMRQRCEARWDGVKTCSPIVTIHAAYSPGMAPATACQRTATRPPVGGARPP